jgi:hypothetical protein
MTLGESGFEGCVDRIENGWVLGWAWHINLPDAPIEVDVYLDGHQVASAEAKLYRPDLERAGKGNGRHAFEVALPERFHDRETHLVLTCFSGTERSLKGSPQTVCFGSESAGSQPQPIDIQQLAGPRFHSRFGGLWTDLTNAHEMIEGKAALGQITAEEAGQLQRWVEDGFVILPQAVSHELIDRLETDVEEIWDGRSSAHCFVEFYEAGQMVIYPAGPEFKNKLNKLLDLYAHLRSAREVVFAPAILRFLTLIFERPALAFQGLCFRWGSQQAIHQDSAFVKVSSPLEFAASWVALEDIQPGSGELEYYVGSHRLEDYLFEGRYKWMPLKSPEYQRFIDSLRERSEALGLERQRFLPKKGDVLLWSADLAHGGSPDVQPGLTRKSIVTHYCPINCEPVYADPSRRFPRSRYSDIAYFTCPKRD